MGVRELSSLFFSFCIYFTEGLNPSLYCDLQSSGEAQGSI